MILCYGHIKYGRFISTEGFSESELGKYKSIIDSLGATWTNRCDALLIKALNNSGLIL